MNKKVKDVNEYVTADIKLIALATKSTPKEESNRTPRQSPRPALLSS